jgi:hypothetical protein
LFLADPRDKKLAKALASTHPRFKAQETVVLHQSAAFICAPGWKGLMLPLRTSIDHSAKTEVSGYLLIEAGADALTPTQIRFLHEISRHLGLLVQRSAQAAAKVSQAA